MEARSFCDLISEVTSHRFAVLSSLEASPRSSPHSRGTDHTGMMRVPEAPQAPITHSMLIFMSCYKDQRDVLHTCFNKSKAFQKKVASVFFNLELLFDSASKKICSGIHIHPLCICESSFREHSTSALLT